MAGVFWATLWNLKERGKLLWSRPVTSWNHIDQCKQKIVNCNPFDPIYLPPYLDSLWWSWSTSSSHLFHPEHCAWLAGNFKYNFFVVNDGNYCAPEQFTSKPVSVLQIPWNAKNSKSCVCALCFTFSLTIGWSTNCVCTVGFQLLSIL